MLLDDLCVCGHAEDEHARVLLFAECTISGCGCDDFEHEEGP